MAHNTSQSYNHIEPFGMRSLFVANSLDETHFCTMSMSVRPRIARRSVDVAFEKRGSISGVSDFDFTFEAHGVTWDAFSMMSGQPLVNLISGVDKYIEMRVGNELPTNLSITGRSVDGSRSVLGMALVLSGVTITQLADITMNQGRFISFKGRGSATTLRYVQEEYISANAPLTSPLLHYNAMDFSLVLGDPISTWPDRQNVMPLFSPIVAQQPTFDPKAYNALPGVDFDGVDDSIFNALFPLLDQPYTIMIMMRINGTPPTYGHFLTGGTFDEVTFSIDDPLYVLNCTDFGINPPMPAAALETVPVAQDINLVRVHTLIADSDENSSEHWRSSTLLSNVLAGQGYAGLSQLGGLSLGGHPFAGGPSTPITVFEVMVWDKRLSDTERILYQSQMLAGWGVTD